MCFQQSAINIIVIIVSDNGLVSNKRLAIIWANDGLVWTASVSGIAEGHLPGISNI